VTIALTGCHNPSPTCTATNNTANTTTTNGTVGDSVTRLVRAEGLPINWWHGSFPGTAVDRRATAGQGHSVLVGMTPIVMVTVEPRGARVPPAGN